MPRHHRLCCHHHHASKQGTANNAQAPLFVPPPPPLCILLLPPPALSKPSTARSRCCQHKDITTTIIATTSSLPANEGVHPQEESHIVCHGHGTSSGARDVVGIAPPQQCRRRAPPPQLPRRWWQSPLGQRGGGYGATVIVKATDLPRTGHCCLPGGRDHHDATIWVHPALPRCPLTPLHLTTAMPTRCHGEAHS